MKKKRLLAFVLIILGLGVLSVIYPYLTGEKQIIKNYELEDCFVERIIDGDTLVCSNIVNNITIRLLGINTPEKGEFYYQEAKDFLRQLENKEVKILRDFDDLGKYGRTLRYIFYEDRFVNIEILEQGYGVAFMTENLVYEDKLLRAEEVAKEGCFGVWMGKC